MTLATPLDPAVPGAAAGTPGRGPLGRLAGALPRRRPAPTPPGTGHPAVGHPAAGHDGVPAHDPGPDSVPGPRTGTEHPSATAPERPWAPAPVTDEHATLAAPLARVDGWLTARSGNLAASPPVAAHGDVRPHAAGAVADPTTSGTVTAGPARLLLDDGRRVPLTGTVLVGRNPAPRSGEAVAALVAVPDPARSVSKTHLTVGVDAAGAWVVDRHSTNGTVVALPDGQRILCVPERRVRLVPGASVRFGDHGFTLAGVPTPADRR